MVIQGNTTYGEIFTVWTAAVNSDKCNFPKRQNTLVYNSWGNEYIHVGHVRNPCIPCVREAVGIPASGHCSVYQSYSAERIHRFLGEQRCDIVEQTTATPNNRN